MSETLHIFFTILLKNASIIFLDLDNKEMEIFFKKFSHFMITPKNGLMKKHEVYT